ncbi:unnamed protein product [Caenorhabditis nigoni]
MSFHYENASSPSGGEADEQRSDTSCRLKNPTWSERSKAKHSAVKSVSNPTVSLERSIQSQDGVKSTDKRIRVQKSNEAENVNPGDRFGRQTSSDPSSGISGTEQRLNNPLLPESGDGDKVTLLKSIEHENIPFIMVNEPSGYSGKVQPFSGQGAQDFSKFLRSFEDNCKFEDVLTPEKKLAYLLTLLEDGPRDRADEALSKNPTITLEDLIKHLKYRFENPMYTLRYKEQLRTTKKDYGESISSFYSRVTTLAKKAHGGSYNEETERTIVDSFFFGLEPEMRVFVQSRQPKTLDDYLQAALLSEFNETTMLQPQQVVPSPTNELSELRSMLNKITEYLNQKEGCSNQGSHNQHSMDGQVFANQVNREAQQSRHNEDSGSNGVGQSFNRAEILKVSCFYCHMTGHLASGCPIKRADKRNHRSQVKINAVHPVATYRQMTPPADQSNVIQQQLLNNQQVLEHYKREIRWKDEQRRMSHRRNEELAAAQWSSSPERRIMMVHKPESKEVTTKEPVADLGIKGEGTSSFITAQVPVRVNGYSCSALIDTGASISVASSEAAQHLGLLNLDPSTSPAALGLGGSSVSMAGSQIVTFQIGSLNIDQRVHFTDGPCFPRKADSYLFILGNDALSRLPRFSIDYGRRELHIGEDVLPLGKGNRGPLMPTVTHDEKVQVNSSAKETTPTIARQQLDKPEDKSKQSTRQKGSCTRSNQSGFDHCKDGKGHKSVGQTRNKDGTPSRRINHQETKGTKPKPSKDVALKTRTETEDTTRNTQKKSHPIPSLGHNLYGYLRRTRQLKRSTGTIPGQEKTVFPFILSSPLFNMLNSTQFNGPGGTSGTSGRRNNATWPVVSPTRIISCSTFHHLTDGTTSKQYSTDPNPSGKLSTRRRTRGHRGQQNDPPGHETYSLTEHLTKPKDHRTKNHEVELPLTGELMEDHTDHKRMELRCKIVPPPTQTKTTQCSDPPGSRMKIHQQYHHLQDLEHDALTIRTMTSFPRKTVVPNIQIMFIITTQRTRCDT